ncbi:flavodoxin [Bifidobacterium pullorum subsp. saeculare]|uniref:flavodoxin n=1 Tax=Bifidobacterium pullorum TaxID=78448 RepID=UPI00195C1D5D|nr:flavodoxin [Bifidobacterium pullorum]MBM6691761.1 flavodoxin [Bifidobacterium pullorum subsp. saeculare]
MMTLAPWTCSFRWWPIATVRPKAAGTDESSRVNAEHEDESLRDIELVSSTVDNWDEYDTVFIGYPIWWGIAAWPVNAFVTANDFTGKTVIPFCTSSSSSIGDSGALLADMAGTGDWLGGERFPSGADESAVGDWVAELGL